MNKESVVPSVVTDVAIMFLCLSVYMSVCFCACPSLGHRCSME